MNELIEPQVHLKKKRCNRFEVPLAEKIKPLSYILFFHCFEKYSIKKYMYFNNFIFYL